jgi:hypothetical protein
MSAKFSNKVKRKLSETKQSIGNLGSKIRSTVKFASKKIGYGEEKWINKIRKLQKRKFKELHQQTYFEEGEDEKKKAAINFLKASADALSSTASDASASAVVAVVAETANLSHGKKWSPQSKVKRSLYVKKISDYVSESLLKWENATARQRKGLIFLRNGKAIHIFSMPFFNDTIHGDDELVSWSEFKLNVFYAYLRNMTDNTNKVKAEIMALGLIKSAFKELLSEVEVVQKPPSPAPAGDESTTPLIVSSVPSLPSAPAVPADAVLYGDLYKRLSDFKAFAAGDEFWSLPCWDEANLGNSVTENDFIERWVNHKTVEDLEVTLHELEDEQRVSVSENSLLLTASSCSAVEAAAIDAGAGDDFDDENNGETKRSDIGKSKRQFLDDIRLTPGIPQEITKIYPDSSRVTRIILRKLILVVKKKRSSNADFGPLDVSRELFQNNFILFTKARAEFELLIQQENQRYLLDVKKANKSKKTAAEALEVVESEHSVQEGKLFVERDQLKAEYGQLNTLFRRNFRRQLKRYNSNLGDALTNLGTAEIVDYNLLSEQAFKLQQDGLNKSVSTSALAAAEDLPASINYTAELHEALEQQETTLFDHAYLYALKALKEWQEFNGNGLVERLSLDFLKALIIDYNPNADDRNLIDALDVLRLYGISTEAAFEAFLVRRDKDSAKSQAQLLAHACQYLIDEFFKVKNVDEFKSTLFKYGPGLLTLPVYNKSAEKFWSVDSNKTKLGYQTVLVTGYDDVKNVFFIRNSLGKKWGKLGNSEISYDDAFAKNTQAVAVVDGGNRRVKKQAVREVDPLTAKIVDIISLVENSSI